MAKKLLFDRYHISNHGLACAARGDFDVRCNPPQKAEEPFLSADRPWESCSIGWANMLREDGIWRVWYEAWDAAGSGSDMDGRLCYAESADGVRWVKPSLGLCEYGGSRENNIVMDRVSTGGLGLHGHSIFVDPTSPPQARYRCFFEGAVPAFGGHREIPVMSYAYSADGLRWVHGAPELPADFNHFPMVGFGSDTQCVVSWDGDLRRYVGYFRAWQENGSRCVARSETASLPDWPMPRTVLAPDLFDGFEADYYNSAATKVVTGGDTAHYIFYSYFNHRTGRLQARLATSRDGIHYDRGDRSPYLDNGTGFDRGGIYVCPGIFDLDDGRQAVIYQAEEHLHGEPSAGYDGHIAMAAFGRDRLQGIHTSAAFEFTVTGDVDPHSPQVTLNAAIRGRVRAGLISDWKWIPGYTPDDCIPAEGDGTDLPLRWRGGPTDVTKASLKILAEDATLYAVTLNEPGDDKK